MRCVRILVFMLLIVVEMMCEVWANRYAFTRLTTDNGLMSNKVMAIVQDKQGFVWFATNNGVSRFDSKSFRSYFHSLPNHNNNTFWSACVDAYGELWFGSDGVSRYNRMNDSIESFTLATNCGKTITKRVEQIVADHEGNVYFLEQASGIYRFSQYQSKLTFYPPPKGEVVTAFWIDNKGVFFCGTESGDMYRFYPVDGSYIQFTEGNLHLRGDPIQKITGNDHSIYIGYQYSGVIAYDRLLRQYSTAIQPHAHHSANVCVHDMLCHQGQLLVASESGFHIYNEQTKEIKHLQRDFSDPYSLSDNALYSVGVDREGGVWLGTYFSGVNHLPAPQYNLFDKYYPSGSKGSISGKAVREMCQDRNGMIWVGTEDAGLNRFDPTMQTFKAYNRANIHGMEIVGDKLYVGVYAEGLQVLDTKSNKVSEYKIIDDFYNITANSIYSICCDKNHNVWIGARQGIYLFNPIDKTFQAKGPFKNLFIHHLMCDHSGKLWASALRSGVYRYDPRTNETISISDSVNKYLALSTNQIISTYEDSRHRIWMATLGSGVIMYNPKENLYKQYATHNGLPNNTVYRVVDDESGRVWLGTNQGLVSIDHDRNEIHTYTKNDGLPTNQFNYNSAFRDNKGLLYFGTTSGLIRFNPNEIAVKYDYPELLFTGFQIFNREVRIGQDTPLRQSITETDSIELAHNQNTIGIDFAVLRYYSPLSRKCSVILEGAEKQWAEVDEGSKLTYSNLSPGSYTLRVKVVNNAGVWQESRRVLFIKVHPPFWKTAWAYLFYLLLLLATGASLYIKVRNQLYRKHERWREKMETAKEKEAYQAKIDFFVKIAHEIKTPLTLIKIPLGLVLKKRSYEPDVQESLGTIERNTNRLLDLTYQLLDFQRIENRSFTLSLEEADLEALIESVHKCFKHAIEEKRIAYTFNRQEGQFVAEVDVENTTKIISNLLDNAIKFCKQEIEVRMDRDLANEKINIVVKNDGPLIPKEMHTKIFEAFVQLPLHASSGTSGRGIGLSLAKSLAQLHGGNLTIETTDGYNRFALSLPMKQPLPTIEETTTEEETEDKRMRLLMVEDNRELSRYIGQRLSREYHILKASNGEAALAVLNTHEVDIVISDVMMPKMDGIELLNRIKSNVYYSHIPVVLLTARAGLQFRIEGLESGADAYIEKPFSMEHLQAQLSSLISNRNNVRKRFKEHPATESEVLAITKTDELFLQRLNKVMEKNLNNTQLSVDLLAEQMNMSRTNLHRKIKGVSGQTPNDYIRTIRLKRAAQLIIQGELRINEVSEATGFTSASYFTKCFCSHFGVLPKEYNSSIHPK